MGGNWCFNLLFCDFWKDKNAPNSFFPACAGLRVKEPGGKTKKESVRNSIKDKQ
jgi:hypothetical protein